MRKVPNLKMVNVKFLNNETALPKFNFVNET